MNAAHVLLIIFWLLYGVQHSVFAATSVKQWFYRKMQGYARYYRLIYTMFVFLTLVLILWYQWKMDSVQLSIPAWIRWFPGLPFLLIGSFFMGVSIRKYFMQLSGITSLISNEDATPKLEITGLHRLVRHPLYLGTLMFIWGLFIFRPLFSNLIACIIITLYTLIGIRFEEKKLVTIFGESYLQYRRVVPMILPFT